MLLQASIDRFQPLRSRQESFRPGSETIGEPGVLDLIQRFSCFHLSSHDVGRIVEHLAEHLELGRAGERAVAGDDFSVGGEFRQDPVQLPHPVADVPAVGHVQKREHAVEKHVAHMHRLMTADEDNRIPVGVRQGVMHQPDHFFCGVCRELVGVCDVGQGLCREGLDLSSQQDLILGHQLADVFMSDDRGAESQCLVASCVAAVPVCVYDLAHAVAAGQGADGGADLICHGLFHGVNQQHSRRIGHRADVAAPALQHVDGPGHGQDGYPGLALLRRCRHRSRRSPVYGRRGMVAASQPLAVAAGLEILAEGIPAATVVALAQMGHPVGVVSGYERAIFGRGQIILRDPVSGVLCGGSDPRADGCAMAAAK